jgi:hypothetical protein
VILAGPEERWMTVPEAFNDELTRSAQLNEVIRSAREVWQGEGSDDALKASLKALTTLRRELRSMLRRSIKYQEKNSLSLAEAPKVEKNLESLRDGIDEAYRYFKDRKKEHLQRGIGLCREAFGRLFESFDLFKAEEEKWTVHSELPYQNELMHLGYGVMKGTISSSAFRDRLDALKVSIRSFYDHFDHLAPHPGERDFFEAHRQEIKKAFRAYLKGLDETALYFSDGRLEHIKKGLEATKEASDQVLHFQHALTEAGEGPKKKLCFKCGKENEASSRCCTSCSAAFPVFEGNALSGMDIRLDTDGNVHTSSHVETGFSKKLTSAVASVKEGAMTTEKFRSYLDDVEQKAIKGTKDKERLGEARTLFHELPSLDVLEEIDDLMMMGFSEVLEGVEQMRRYFTDGDESHLTFGLESALSGADRIARVQVITEQVKKQGSPRS